MNKTLLIDLKAGHVNKIKWPDDHEVAILVYKDCSRQLQNVNKIVTTCTPSIEAVDCRDHLAGEQLRKIYEINRKKMISIKSSPLFSDTFALNEFMSSLGKVRQMSWDYVVNIGDDRIATLLTSYLVEQQKCKHIGVCLNRDQSIHYSNYWAIIYHDILHGPLDMGLSIAEIIHRMAGWNYNQDSEEINIYRDLIHLFSGEFSDLPQHSYRKTRGWVNGEKEKIALASKILLSCLRSINQMKSRQKHGESFTQKLDQLLELCHEKSVVSLPVILFRAEMESLGAHDIKSNIALSEKNLFTLKNNLRQLYTFIDSLVREEASPPL